MLGQVCYLQLLLRWEVPAGTGLLMQLLVRLWYSVAWVIILCNQVGWLSYTHHHCIIGVKKLSEPFLASLRSTKVSHIVTKQMNHEVCIHILLLALFATLFWLSWGSYHWDRFAIYSLLLSWGPIAGTDLLFTALLSCGSQMGQGLIMQSLAESLLTSMGDGWTCPQTFQNTFCG